MKNKRGTLARGGFQTLPAPTDPQMNSEKEDGYPASSRDSPENPDVLLESRDAFEVFQQQ